jgi:hypothetical protein
LTLSSDDSPGVNNLQIDLALHGGAANGSRYGAIQVGDHGYNWERLILQPNGGNVGIGTSTPQARLHVGGTAVVDSSVGIGTTTPGKTLEAKGTGALLRSVVSKTDPTPRPLLALTSDDTVGSNNLQLEFALQGGAANGSQYGTIQVADNGFTWERLILQPSGGNVGIGITQPTQKLSVQGGIRLGDSATEAGVAHALMIRRAGADSANYITMINENTVTGSISSGGSGRRQDLVFANDAGGNYIFNTGRVGIGTTAPSERLHVNGNAIVEEDLTAKSSIRAGTPDRKIADGSGCYYA